MERRRALVTGAAHRLGRAMALDLAGSGWDVAVHYNSSAADARRAVEEARVLGGRAEAVQADLLVEAEVATLIGRASEALGGPLSLLINNASIFRRSISHRPGRTINSSPSVMRSTSSPFSTKRKRNWSSCAISSA